MRFELPEDTARLLELADTILNLGQIIRKHEKTHTSSSASIVRDAKQKRDKLQQRMEGWLDNLRQLNS